MSFLSALFLFALPAIGVPIVLHFYKGRQVDTIDWGAMHFLEDAVSDGRRWEKLEELLLMLLRALAVAALVFALAQPMVRGSWLGQHNRREVVVIIDDSLSTAVELDGQRVFDLVQRGAVDAVDELTSEDRVQLLAASGGGRWLTPEPVPATVAGRRQLTEAIKALEPTLGAADLLACVRSAAALERDESAAERLVLLVTDGQASAFHSARDSAGAGDLSGWAAWGEARPRDAMPLAIRVVDCGLGERAPGNLAIGRVTASQTVVRSGDRVNLTCQVANFGFETAKPARVEWRLGDRLLAKTRVGAVAPGETSEAVAVAELKETGPQLITCSLTDDDSLPLDQSAPIVVEVADRLPLLVVESPPEADGDDRTLAASRHVAASLGYLDGKPQPWRSVYEPRVAPPAELPDVRLSDYRVVLLLSPDALEQDDVDRLQGFVAAGGGLWATLDQTLDAERFNSLWHDDGEGLCPLAVGEPVGTAAEEEDWPEDERADEGGASIHPPDGDHPATTHLANTTQLDIDQAIINRYWRFSVPGDERADKVSVLLRTGGGDPLAIERYFGRGRVIVQAFTLDRAGSTLPFRKAYVPLVHDWLDYLAAPTRDRHNLAPGAAIVASAPEADARASARVVTPGGDEIELTRRGDLALPVYRFGQTRLPGLYRVQFRAGGETLSELTYQTPRQLRESSLEPLGGEARERLTQLAGLEFDSDANQPVTQASAESRLAPFWWTLLMLLAVFIVLELLAAYRVSWRRMGNPAPL